MPGHPGSGFNAAMAIESEHELHRQCDGEASIRKNFAGVVPKIRAICLIEVVNPHEVNYLSMHPVDPGVLRFRLPAGS